MNGEAFLADIEQCLAPTLRRGDIVVADNVSFHKVAGPGIRRRRRIRDFRSLGRHKAEYLGFDRTSFDVCNTFGWKQDTGLVHTFKIGLNYKFW